MFLCHLKQNHFCLFRFVNGTFTQLLTKFSLDYSTFLLFILNTSHNLYLFCFIWIEICEINLIEFQYTLTVV